MRKKLIALLLTAGLALPCGIPAVGTGAAAAEDAAPAEEPPAMQEVYEAEAAELTAALTGNELDDFSGEGYVNTFRLNGTVSFSVTGSKIIVVRELIP